MSNVTGLKEMMNVGLQSSHTINEELAEKQLGKGRYFLALYLTILLVLTVYQDFPLVNRIGEIGRSPIILLLPLFVFCEIAMLSKYKRFMAVSKLQKYVFAFIVYLAFVTLGYILVQFLQGSYSFWSEGLLGKGIKVLTYFVLILLYIRHMQLVFSKMSFKLLYASFLVVVSLLFVIMMVELATMPSAFTFLHSGSQLYWRVRLLTSESSTTGAIVVAYSSILVYLSRYVNRFARILSNIYVAVFFLFYISVTGSKGFFIVCLLTLVVTMLKFMDFRRKRNFIVLIGMVIVMYLFIAYFSAGLISSFQNDIENYTSSYTRMGTILISIITVFHHPFGVGTGAYLMYFDDYMNDAISFMSHFYYNIFGISQINAGELLQYAGSDKNLGVKSGFFQWFMFGGIFSLVFFYLLAKNLISKAKSSMILFMALIFMLFSFLVVTLEIKYEIWMLFAFISSFLGEKEINHSNMSGVSK